MERQRRQQQEAAAAAVLHAALVLLNRGGVCKEPLSPAMFARPNLKGLQAALHLLHHRIRGAVRTKKELQHIFPVLEPGQAREFKAAMRAWICELGAAGLVLPDTVKYFVTAYGGGNSHRTVLMLLDLGAVALARELGEGPLVGLKDVELVQPHQAAARGSLLRGALVAAAVALRQSQGRMEKVVAAMQRLKQLQAQTTRQLAAGQAASGAAAAGLAPHVPPLFAGSQAVARRGEIVLELLSHGPPLTAQPEVVWPDSWADLLAAGKADVASKAGATAAAAARRLSNPAQEASNFAAEGLAVDADVISVHSVLAQRLAAAGAVLQAAVQGGTGPRSLEVRAALAEAAVYRESLMLSVRQELAAGQVRSELQVPASGGSSNSRPAMLQLLPPSLLPCNPVLEGLQAAQESAAAAKPLSPASGNCGWETPEADMVQALRRSMWQRAESECSGASSQPADEMPAPLDAEPTAAESVAAAQALATPLLHGRDAGAAEAGSSSSRPVQWSRLPGRQRINSPSLADMLGNSSSFAALPLLSESLDELPGVDLTGLPSPQHDSWPSSRQQQQQQQHGSPCMAESCASASVMGDSHGQRSNGSSTAATATVGSRHRPMPLAASPMLFATANFMPPRQQQLEQQRQRVEHLGELQESSSSLPSAAAIVALPSLPLALLDDFSSIANIPRPLSTSQDTSPVVTAPAAAVPWREAARAAAASVGAAGSPDANSHRRRAARVTFTLTPPKRLADDSPVQQQQQQQQQRQQQADFASPLRPHVERSDSGSSSGNATPVSKLFTGVHNAWQGSPAPSPVLQPVQQQPQHFQQQHWMQLGHNSSGGSPSDALLASCFKSSKGAALSSSPLVSVPLLDDEQQAPKAACLPPQQPAVPSWMPAATRCTSPVATPVPAGPPSSSLLSADSGSMSRRRSAALHTTRSPGIHQHPHRLASGGAELMVSASDLAADDDLLNSLRALGSTASHSQLLPHAADVHSKQQEERSSAAGLVTLPCWLTGTPDTVVPVRRIGLAASTLTSGAATTGAAGGVDISALVQRMALLPNGRR